MVAERALTPTGPQTMVNIEERDKLLRNLILRDASPEQFQLVLAICRRYGFDPLLRHVLIVSNNLYVTRDGLRHMAWQSGEFDGYDPPEERQDAEGKWIVTVKVYRKGIARPFTATAYQSESENPRSPVWKSNPRLMTGKVAEVIALRMAFGVSLGGAEEIGFDDSSQTRIGAARFVEAGVQEAAPVAIMPPPMTEAEYEAFSLDLERKAADGLASKAIAAWLSEQNPRLSERQNATIKVLWKSILQARKAGEAWPHPDQQPAAPIEATVVEAPQIEVTALGDGSQPATARQVKFIYAIGREANLDQPAVDTLARGLFGGDVDRLNRRDAALLIEEVQRQRNEGYQRPQAESDADNALEDVPFD